MHSTSQGERSSYTLAPHEELPKSTKYPQLSLEGGNSEPHRLFDGWEVEVGVNCTELVSRDIRGDVCADPCLEDADTTELEYESLRKNAPGCALRFEYLRDVLIIPGMVRLQNALYKYVVDRIRDVFRKKWTQHDGRGKKGSFNTR